MTISDPLRDVPLDWTYKGLDAAAAGLTIDAVGTRGLHLFADDVLFPAAVLKRSALRRNSAWMRTFLAASGVRIAPHGKTTMAPELFRRQMEDGAWAMTAATVQHVRAYRRFGIQRILLANQLVGAGAIRWVLAELARDPHFDFYCLVDSMEGVQLLAEAAAAYRPGRPLQLLVEVGRAGGRAGVRTLEQGRQIAQAVARHAGVLRLAGVEAFEGAFQMSPDAEQAATAMLDLVVSLARACDAQGLFDDRIMLTAGGSSFFDLVAGRFTPLTLSRPIDVVLRSGCYLSHDDGMYAKLFASLQQRSAIANGIDYGLEPALQIWSQVLSRPEPGRVICSFGKRDAGNDAHAPVPVAWARPADRGPREMPAGHCVVGLHDQHAFLDVPADSPLRVGDFVGCGISHPCTTFDKWRLLLEVDEDYRIVGAMRTYF